MKQKWGVWQWMGFAAVALLGTLLHFLYDWTGGNTFAAVFSGVNESTWEHMKLLYWPWLWVALVQYRFFKDKSCFWCIKAKGVTLGMLLIPTIFYTYNGAFGKSPDWLNITIFFVTAAGVFLAEYRWLLRGKPRCSSPKKALAYILLWGALFILFTFWPPKIPLFLDPVTSNYGM